MIRGMSVYDLKTLIRKNLSAMCSASAGSIYTALKKLLEKEYIGEESLEGDSRDKKMYYITKLGREEFLQWINEPMNAGKTKNIELAKLFYGGIRKEEEQIVGLKSFVKSMKEELQMLQRIRGVQGNLDSTSIKSMQKFLYEDHFNSEGIKALNEQTVSSEMIERIYRNQMLTLDYGIASIEFQISWYEKTIIELENENE